MLYYPALAEILGSIFRIRKGYPSLQFVILHLRKASPQESALTPCTQILSISTPQKKIFGENRCFFSNHLNLSTKSRIPLNRGALNPGLSVYIYIERERERERTYIVFHVVALANIYKSM